MREQRGGSTLPDFERARAGRLAAGDPRVIAVASAIVALIDAIAGGGASLRAGAAGGQSAPAETYYTSRKGGPYIPGKSRAWMLRQAHSIPGARKIGRDWVIKSSDFESYLVQRDIARARAASGGNGTDLTVEALVEEAMRLNGMRAHGR